MLQCCGGVTGITCETRITWVATVLLACVGLATEGSLLLLLVCCVACYLALTFSGKLFFILILISLNF